MKDHYISPHTPTVASGESRTYSHRKTALRATGAVLFLGTIAGITGCGPRQVDAQPAAANSESPQAPKTSKAPKSPLPTFETRPGDGARIPLELRSIVALRCRVGAGSSGNITPDAQYVCGKESENMFSIAYHHKGSLMAETYEQSPLRFIGGIANFCVSKTQMGEIYEKKGTLRSEAGETPACADRDYTFEDLDAAHKELFNQNN